MYQEQEHCLTSTLIYYHHNQTLTQVKYPVFTENSFK